MSLSYEHLLTASHILRIKSRLLTRLCLSWPLPTSLTLSPTNLFLVHIDLAILGFVPPWAHVKLVATLGPLQLALAFAWNPLPRPPRGCPFLLTQVFPKCGPTKRPSWSIISVCKSFPRNKEATRVYREHQQAEFATRVRFQKHWSTFGVESSPMEPGTLLWDLQIRKLVVTEAGRPLRSSIFWWVDIVFTSNYIV